jgi:hypothetical protein
MEVLARSSFYCSFPIVWLYDVMTPRSGIPRAVSVRWSDCRIEDTKTLRAVTL